MAKRIVPVLESIRVSIRIAIRRVVPRVVRYKILNIKAEDGTSVADNILRKGDELCRGRMIPMSSQLIKEVRNIYERCRSEDIFEEKPLIKASRLGLTDMVWGFIQCAKQTNTNLHSSELSYRPEAFIWLQNRRNQTALDVAIQWNHLEVAKLLLRNASDHRLTLECNSKGKALLPLLSDPIHDQYIFYILENAKKEDAGPQATSALEWIYNQDTVDWYNIYEREKYWDKLDRGLLELNPSKNTILHLVSEFGDVNYVKDIIEKDPSLIYRHNSEGETPAYVAAREGHLDILKIMINNLKGKNDDIEFLFTRVKDKHNALHIAIQNHHAAVVFLLIEEIPQLANHINDFNESPLYLAAERGYFNILSLILMKCEEKTFEGPNGTTALHAAAISNSAACVRYLLAEKPSLLRNKDDNGWTPLRYAVYHNSALATKELLNEDYSIGYELMAEGDISTSAIHIAARLGHFNTMKVLMNTCLGCSKFIDNKGRNILHVSIESNKTEVIEFIFQHKSLTSLINQKDCNGNTPAHLLVASNFEMMERVIDYRVDINAFNNEKFTPLDMANSDEKKEILIRGIAMGTNIHKKPSSLSSNIRKSDLSEKESEVKAKESEARFKIVDNLVLVVTLIATATFAAGFTVPGGFDSTSGSKQGTPYLLKKSAFQAFVVTNSIAFSCSCSVLLGHIVLLTYRNSYDEADFAEQKNIDDRIVVMYVVTGIALLAMLIAFVTGLYVVLTPSFALAISVCVTSLCIVISSFTV